MTTNEQTCNVGQGVSVTTIATYVSQLKENDIVLTDEKFKKIKEIKKSRETGLIYSLIFEDGSSVIPLCGKMQKIKTF